MSPISTMGTTVRTRATVQAARQIIVSSIPNSLPAEPECQLSCYLHKFCGFLRSKLLYLIFNPPNYKLNLMEEYISFEQIPFGSESFADNPEPRCPCVLLLDTSGSMAGQPIHQLNEGIKTLRDELQNDQLAKKRVEVAVVTFGPVKIVSDFTTVANFYPQELEVSGDTPMGSAISFGIELAMKRKQEYKDHGIGHYKPWIILITDGAPTDSYSKATLQVKQGEADKAFSFFAIGVDSADMKILREISVREPAKLKGYMFREFFLWLSSSLKSVSSKNPGESNKLPPPSGWFEL